MTARVRMQLFLGVLVLMVMVGCTGKRITTAVEGQTMPSPSASTPAPPVSASGERAQPLAEIPAETPKTAAPTAAEPSAEEGRVVQEPMAEAVPLQPASPQSGQPTESPPASFPSQDHQLQGGLSDIYFNYDQYLLRGDAQSVLEANAAFLKTKPGHTVVIEGHCDERGTSAYNLVLGERRAAAAKRYLQDLGVEPSRIRIVSYGKERPFCMEHSEACWQANRRAHFKLQ